jgi:hypothetical protein
VACWRSSELILTSFNGQWDWLAAGILIWLMGFFASLAEFMGIFAVKSFFTAERKEIRDQNTTSGPVS